MRIFLKNKKGVSEIVSFVFLTLIVVLASTIVYFFATNLIDDTISKSDRDSSLIYFKLMKEKLNMINNFDDSTTSINLRFKKGSYVFSGNKISYQSLESYLGISSCIEDICYESVGGFEKLYFNLSNSYNFSENITLYPDLYKVTFKNIKNESKISISIK